MPSPTSAQQALNWLAAHSPPPSSAPEALALYIHALLLTHGFRPAETPSPSTPDALPETLPSTWGTAWGGRYRHQRSALTFDIRLTTVGARLVMHAVVAEDDADLHTAELRVADFVDEGAVMTREGDGEAAVDWGRVLRRVDDVATVVQVQIAHRLVPDATKEGYEEGVHTIEEEGRRTGGGSASGMAGRIPGGGEREGGGRMGPLGPLRGEPGLIDPLRDDPLRDDPLRIGGRRYPGVGGFGRDDLVAPGLPGGPGGMFGGMGGGMGGNLMGPGNFPGMGMGRGRGRGDGRPEGVPPGARFDPYGPVVPDNDIEGMPGFEDEHGLGLGGGRGRGRGAPRGGGFGEGPPTGMYW